MKTNNRSIHVVIPACEEEEHIEQVIEGLKRVDQGLKIWVIDDGSRDQTAEKARQAGARVIRHSLNLGQWAALKTGFTAAMMEGAEILASIDADGQHEPEDLPKLVEPILNGKVDIVIGSRFLNAEKPEMAGYRRAGIRLFNILVNALRREKLTDCTSGYRAYKAEAIRSVLSDLRENQYGALEFIIKATNQKCRISEESIKPRDNSVSKKGKLKYGYNLLRSVIKVLT